LYHAAPAYNSFSTVVLFLKVLLSQQSLDTPFTGGLGSYKLYVLVADHLQRHLTLGGSDRPGEVLLSFLYRYGCCGASRNDSSHQTRLSQHRPLQALDGASADLSNVFKLDACIQLFRLCWDRLSERVQESRQLKQEAKRKTSLLAVVICPDRLRREREASLRLLKQSLVRLQPVMNTLAPSAAKAQAATAQSKKVKSPPIDPRQRAPTNRRDRTLEEIVAGYGVDVEDLNSL
jgi:hypothetical protein